MKLTDDGRRYTLILISPGLIAGSGLKQAKLKLATNSARISPGLIAGSGLKPSRA